MPWRARAVVLVAILVLSSVGSPAAAAVTEPAPAGTQSPDEPPPDPANDTIGWECGYWHDESVGVDQSDGLDEEELDAVVCRTMARVEEIRNLEFNETVSVSIQGRDELREQFENQSTDPALRTFDNAKFEAMFLVNESVDSIGVQNRNSGVSVLGYYSPASEEIVLVAPNRSAVRIDEFTLAHELVHALQDQHFNLSRDRGETRDEVNARDGLVEGEAGYVEHRYREGRCLDPEHPWNGSCLVPRTGGQNVDGTLANYGVYFLKYQPYSDGPAFVADLVSNGNWSAVDAAHEDPPASAAQVIHPAKYRNDSSANVTLTDRNATGWERVRPPNRPDYAEVGQAGVASMIAYPLYHGGRGGQIVSPTEWLNYTVDPVTGERELSSFDPLNYGFDAAEGWDGDRLHVYENDANETAYVWRLAWDSTDDADEFLDAYRQVLAYWGAERVAADTYRIPDGGFADAVRVIEDNETVTIVNAPNVTGIDDVRNGSLPANVTATNGTIEADGPPTWTDANGTAPGTRYARLESPGQPGFGVAAAVVALALAGLARRRD